MSSRPSAGQRPTGTDGSDYAFRMTVQDRYKKIAEQKLQLRRVLLAQVVVHIVKAVSILVIAYYGALSNTSLFSCIFGGVAILVGTSGLKRSSKTLLNVYVFSSSAAIALSILLYGSHNHHQKVATSWKEYTSSGNLKSITMEVLETTNGLLVVLLQFLGIRLSFSLLAHLSRRSSK